MGRYPLIIMIVMLGLIWAVSRLHPSTFDLGVVVRGTGWLVLLCGVSLLTVAARLFKAKGTTVNPTKEPEKLVTSGLYHVTRNPMYLGMVMILSGFPFVLDSMIGLIFPVIFFLFMDRVVIPEEEKVVEGVFEEAYRKYKSQTRRWL
jgi:protein-S-isoprenylcysteine O-methyltransferase Ste14